MYSVDNIYSSKCFNQKAKVLELIYDCVNSFITDNHSMILEHQSRNLLLGEKYFTYILDNLPVGLECLGLRSIELLFNSKTLMISDVKIYGSLLMLNLLADIWNNNISIPNRPDIFDIFEDANYLEFIITCLDGTNPSVIYPVATLDNILFKVDVSNYRFLYISVYDLELKSLSLELLMSLYRNGFKFINQGEVGVDFSYWVNNDFDYVTHLSNIKGLLNINGSFIGLPIRSFDIVFNSELRDTSYKYYLDLKTYVSLYHLPLSVLYLSNSKSIFISYEPFTDSLDLDDDLLIESPSSVQHFTCKDILMRKKVI